MDIDELCRKAADAWCQPLDLDHEEAEIHKRDCLAREIKEFIGPEIAERDAEIERLNMELDVLKEFRETDRKALQAFSEWDGNSDLWAAMLTQRDEATQRSLTCCFCNQPCESLEALKAHSGECRAHPLWKDAKRYRDLRTIGCIDMKMTADEFDRDCDREIAAAGL